jgi:mono/diheme cytochrome c family protein
MPSVYKNAKIPLGSTDFAHATGEFVAVSEKTGKILWDTKLSQMPLGDATVVNDLVFTTTFDGYLVALSRKDGHIVLRKKLPAGTNAPVMVQGGTLVTAASYPQGKGQTAQLMAFRVGATGSAAGGTTTTTKTTTSAASASGKALFTSNCATCHTLAAAGAGGTVGPNLDQLKPSAATVAHQVENGGGGMPSFSGRLKQQQINAVSAYVASVAGKKGSGGTTTVVGP